MIFSFTPLVIAHKQYKNYAGTVNCDIYFDIVNKRAAFFIFRSGLLSTKK